MNRKVISKAKGIQTEDGAGVKLVRVLGPSTVKEFDPILMLDSFDSTDPKDYTAGFPMHPHRGIETISYLAAGQMTHHDSMGFTDTIKSGEVQWMTAGSGIMHEELIPASDRMLGVQLWLNLPAKEKMSSPAYHSIKNSEILEIPINGGFLRLLAGEYKGKTGFKGVHLPLDYYDIHLNEGEEFSLDTEEDKSIMLFTLLGKISVGEVVVEEKTAAKLSSGTSISFKSLNGPAEVLFISSKALNEPVAWGGPIVMNTSQELRKAWEDLKNNTFIQHD